MSHRGTDLRQRGSVRCRAARVRFGRNATTRSPFGILRTLDEHHFPIPKGGSAAFFAFPEDDRRNPERMAVEFGARSANIEASCASTSAFSSTYTQRP